MAELASIPADRLMPASVDPGPAGYPPVKVRAAAADLLPTRSLYHQETQSLVRDFLTYDEIPGVTNCSTANLPAGFRIERHVHPSKYEIFLVGGGKGVFRVWQAGASENDEPREVFELRTGVCCTVGPEEPHEIEAYEDGLVLTYLGVVAPESK